VTGDDRVDELPIPRPLRAHALAGRHGRRRRLKSKAQRLEAT